MVELKIELRADQTYCIVDEDGKVYEDDLPNERTAEEKKHEIETGIRAVETIRAGLILLAHRVAALTGDTPDTMLGQIRTVAYEIRDSINDHKQEPIIVMQGSLSDGYKAYGPYASFDEAANECPDGDAWMMELLDPVEYRG